MKETILNQLITIYGNDIYKFCYRLTMNQTDADDLYQDTFLKAIQLSHRLVSSDKPTISADTEAAARKNRNFLMGIAANLWKNQYRKIARANISFSIDTYDNDQIQFKSDIDIEQNWEKKELLHKLSGHINALPEKLKLVTCMYYTGEMKTEEIAHTLHLPKGTIKSRLHLARKRLKKSLEEDGYEV